MFVKHTFLMCALWYSAAYAVPSDPFTPVDLAGKSECDQSVISNMPRVRSQDSLPICGAMSSSTVVQFEMCKIKKIQDCWETHQVLHPSQHGYRRKSGTDAAIIQLINVVEDAEDTGHPIYLSSWDVKTAFTPRATMFLSWPGTAWVFHGKWQNILYLSTWMTPPLSNPHGLKMPMLQTSIQPSATLSWAGMGKRRNPENGQLSSPVSEGLLKEMFALLTTGMPFMTSSYVD